jgi:deoxyribose-phosphate aldolase
VTQVRTDGSPSTEADPANHHARIQLADLRPDATRREIEGLLQRGLHGRFDGVVVNPIWIPVATRALDGSSVRLATVLDVPAGGSTTSVVTRAAGEARIAGAVELEVMTKVGWLRSQMDVAYRQHVAAVVKAADGATVRAVLEAPLLTRHELALAVELCVDAGVTSVMDASGSLGDPASARVASEVARLAAGRLQVKIWGGTGSQHRVDSLVRAGADLVGLDPDARISS